MSAPPLPLLFQGVIKELETDINKLEYYHHGLVLPLLHVTEACTCSLYSLTITTSKPQQGVINELETDINKLERYHQGLFMGFDQLRRTDGDLSLAWEGRLAVERQYIDTATPYVKVSRWIGR